MASNTDSRASSTNPIPELARIPNITTIPEIPHIINHRICNMDTLTKLISQSYVSIRNDFYLVRMTNGTCSWWTACTRLQIPTLTIYNTNPVQDVTKTARKLVLDNAYQFIYFDTKRSKLEHGFNLFMGINIPRITAVGVTPVFTVCEHRISGFMRWLSEMVACTPSRQRRICVIDKLDHDVITSLIYMVTTLLTTVVRVSTIGSRKQIVTASLGCLCNVLYDDKDSVFTDGDSASTLLEYLSVSSSIEVGRKSEPTSVSNHTSYLILLHEPIAQVDTRVSSSEYYKYIDGSRAGDIHTAVAESLSSDPNFTSLWGCIIKYDMASSMVREEPHPVDVYEPYVITMYAQEYDINLISDLKVRTYLKFMHDLYTGAIPSLHILTGTIKLTTRVLYERFERWVRKEEDVLSGEFSPDGLGRFMSGRMGFTPRKIGHGGIRGYHISTAILENGIMTVLDSYSSLWKGKEAADETASDVDHEEPDDHDSDHEDSLRDYSSVCDSGSEYVSDDG